MDFSRTLKVPSRIVVALLLGASLIATPTFASNAGGNGNGNSGGNGNGNSSHSATPEGKTINGVPANDLGSLNGFLHASAKALAHASPKSEIGKVAIVYAGLLGQFLTPVQGTPTPTLADLAAALGAAANRPLSAPIIQAVNDKLGSVNPQLATSIAAYTGGSAGLASAIFQAI